MALDLCALLSVADAKVPLKAIQGKRIVVVEKKGVETTTSQAPLLHQKYLYLGYYRL